MRIILSEGQVNIFNLHSTGASVDQIERFYARNLPVCTGNLIRIDQPKESPNVSAP
jgi:hypothetical protein